jgi:hypothetical protein
MPAPVQYTIRGIPTEIDRTLRRRAKQRGVSLNQLLVEELSAAAGGGVPRRYRSLSGLGKWETDPEFDRILAEQRKIDSDLWK